MIQYFREGLRPSVRAQLDARGRDLDSWEEAVKKAVNAEAKALLQSSFSTRDMDSKYSQGNRLAEKEEKDFGGKNKSTDSASADTSSGKQSSSTQQTSSANPKKDQNYQGGPRHRGRRGRRRGQDSPATGVNITPEKEEKDISHVECFHCRRKGHFANKCPQKKNQNVED